MVAVRKTPASAMSGTIKRRSFLAAASAALLPARAQTAAHGLTAPVIKDISVIATAPAGAAALGGQDRHRSGRPVRLWLRHIHAARRIGECGRREVPAPVSHRQARRSHRGHLAVLLRQLLLAQRTGVEQRHQRSRPGAVGYQGTPGRHAGLRACSAASAAKPRPATRMPRARRSSRPSSRPAASWTRVSATCACRWACQAWRDMARGWSMPGFRAVSSPPSIFAAR